MRANKIMASLMVSAMAIGASVPALAADTDANAIPAAELKTATYVATQKGEKFELPEGATMLQKLVSTTLDGIDFDLTLLEDGFTDITLPDGTTLKASFKAEEISDDQLAMTDLQEIGQEGDMQDSIPATATTMAITIVEE